MFFLLRMAFWLCVVCVLLPSGTKSTSPDAQVDASEAVTFASAAVSDVRGFCERQPDACVTGGKVAVALGHKHRVGVRRNPGRRKRPRLRMSRLPKRQPVHLVTSTWCRLVAARKQRTAKMPFVEERT